MAALMNVGVPFHLQHHLDLRDSRSRIFRPQTDPFVLIPPQISTPQRAMPSGVSSAGGPPRPGAASPRNKEREVPRAAQCWLTLPCSEARGSRKTEWAKQDQASPGQPATQTNTGCSCLPQAQGRDRIGVPVLSPNQRPTSSRMVRTFPVEPTRPSPQAAFGTSLQRTPPGPRKLRPLQRNPAPRRRLGWYAHARKCVPAPGPVPRGPCRSRLCHLTVVVVGGGRGARAAWGREQSWAASPPPFWPGPGSVPPRSFRSPPRSGTGRSKPLPGARGTSWPLPPRVLMEPPNLYPVKLYVYDLSKGLARRLSPIMLGEGVGRGRVGGPGRTAKVGRPGPRPRGRRGAQRMDKSPSREGRGSEVWAPMPHYRFESRGKGWKGITPSPVPSEPLQLGGGVRRRWIRVGSLPRSASPLAPSSAQR